MSSTNASLLTTVGGILEREAGRTLATLHLVSAGVRLAPEAAATRALAARALGLAEHYERLARLYADVTGARIEPVAAELLARLAEPTPSSWYELAVASFVLHRASIAAAAEHETATFGPLATLFKASLVASRAHRETADALVVELTLSRAFEDQKQQLFAKWLGRALASLASIGGHEADDARAFALRLREPEAVAAEFLEGLRPVMKTMGVRFPDSAALGELLPPFTDLSLEGVDNAPEPASLDDRRATIAGVKTRD